MDFSISKDFSLYFGFMYLSFSFQIVMYCTYRYFNEESVIMDII